MRTITLSILFAAAFIAPFTQAQFGQVMQTKLSEKEAALVQQFQSENSGVLTDDYMLSDSFAIGLLRANKWNTASASKSLRKLLMWRASNKITKLGESATDADLRRLFPYQLTTDKDGCPVLEIDGGRWFVADFMESHDFIRDALEVFNRYATQMFEKTRYSTNKLSSQCDQAILIANLKGFTTRNYADPNVLSAVVRIATNVENYYPNLYKTIFVINSNPDFTSLLNTLLPYIGQTSNSIRVFSENEESQARKQIAQFVEPGQLSFY